jgi:hypothetical protein
MQRFLPRGAGFFLIFLLLMETNLEVRPRNRDTNSYSFRCRGSLKKGGMSHDVTQPQEEESSTTVMTNRGSPEGLGDRRDQIPVIPLPARVLLIIRRGSHGRKVRRGLPTLRNNDHRYF